MSSFEHLAAALPVPDAAFDAYWQLYLRARPELVPGATLELEREQLRKLFKLAFLAGREAAVTEISKLATN